MAGRGLRVRGIEIRATAAGRARLFDSPARGLRRGQAAADNLQNDRVARGPHHHLYPYRTAFSHFPQEDSRGSRAGWVRQAGDRERLPVVTPVQILEIYSFRLY